MNSTPRMVSSNRVFRRTLEGINPQAKNDLIGGGQVSKVSLFERSLSNPTKNNPMN